MSYCSIAEHFSRYFQLIVADTPDLKREVYSIRYQVYCEELNYESKEKFPNRLERDAYDNHAIHYLLKHRLSGLFVGCVRVVLPKLLSYRLSLPSQTLFPYHFDLMERSPVEFCEVSRLAVLSQFRRLEKGGKCREGMLIPFSHKSDRQQAKKFFPIIALSLYWTSISIAKALNLNIVALMEPKLARHLNRFGIASHKIGSLLNYRGKRGFFVIKPIELFDNLSIDIRDLSYLIQDTVQTNLFGSHWKTNDLGKYSEEIAIKLMQKNIVARSANLQRFA